MVIFSYWHSPKGYPWEKVKDNIPYSLHWTTVNGRGCGKCKWNKFCLGCAVGKPTEKDEISLNDKGATIAVTWPEDAYQDMFAVKKRVYSLFIRLTTQEVIHQSYHRMTRKETEPLRLVMLVKITTGSIKQCFKDFTAPERIDGDNAWYCSQCKEHRAALIQHFIYRLPPCVVIQLKRFKVSQYSGKLVKISKLVEFPIEGLDFQRYLEDKSLTTKKKSETNNEVYDLYACLVCSLSNHLMIVEPLWQSGGGPLHCLFPQSRRWFVQFCLCAHLKAIGIALMIHEPI